MLLITGATGQLGTAVLQTLLQKLPAQQLAALVRDEQKAADLKAQGVSIRVGDYGDPASLTQAMQGITQVLLISGGGGPDALQQHYHVVDAARQAGVQGISYTSRTLKDPSGLANKLMQRHFQTEDYIQASGLPYLIFRNALYMDVLPLYTGAQVLTTGINLPAGQGKVAFALRREMGEAIANVLAEGRYDNRTYNFTGREAYSFDDVAASLSTLAGQPVRYTPLDVPAAQKHLQERGVPPMSIPFLLSFMADIKNNQEDFISPELETVLGRQPAGLTEGVKELYKL